MGKPLFEQVADLWREGREWKKDGTLGQRLYSSVYTGVPSSMFMGAFVARLLTGNMDSLLILLGALLGGIVGAIMHFRNPAFGLIMLASLPFTIGAFAGEMGGHGLAAGLIFGPPLLIAVMLATFYLPSEDTLFNIGLSVLLIAFLVISLPAIVVAFLAVRYTYPAPRWPRVMLGAIGASAIGGMAPMPILIGEDAFYNAFELVPQAIVSVSMFGWVLICGGTALTLAVASLYNAWQCALGTVPKKEKSANTVSDVVVLVGHNNPTKTG